jgi:hypothetical protein
MDLDTMLQAAAPRVADRCDSTLELLDRLVIETAAAGNARRGRRTMVVTSAAVIGVVAFGGAAAAGVGPAFVQGLFPWASDSGVQCQVVANFEPRETMDPNYSPTQDAALVSAQQWASSFDLDDIDQSVADAAFLDYLGQVSVDHPSRAELEANFHGDELHKHALLWELDKRADQHLRDAGFKPRSLNGGVGMKCAE